MMYWRWISVFSCANFSHSNFRLKRRKRKSAWWMYIFATWRVTCTFSHFRTRHDFPVLRNGKRTRLKNGPSKNEMSWTFLLIYRDLWWLSAILGTYYNFMGAEKFAYTHRASHQRVHKKKVLKENWALRFLTSALNREGFDELIIWFRKWMNRLGPLIFCNFYIYPPIIGNRHEVNENCWKMYFFDTKNFFPSVNFVFWNGNS